MLEFVFLFLLFFIFPLAIAFHVFSGKFIKAFKLPLDGSLYDQSTSAFIRFLSLIYLSVAIVFYLFLCAWQLPALVFWSINGLMIIFIVICPVSVAVLKRYHDLTAISDQLKARKARNKTIILLSLIILLLIANAGVWPLTMFALRTGNITFARWLIENKINLNSADAWNNTPLLFACRQKDTQLVRLLLDQGANVNKWDGFHIWDTPLAACSSSNPEIVKMLLQHGANANVSDDYGTSILMSSHFSVDKTKKNEDIFMLLISHGANMNAKDREGSTVVMHLVHQGNFSLAAKLVEMGAILTNNERITSCFSKLRNWRQGDQPQAWLEFCKMDVNQRDENGSTPLLHSVRTINLELTEELLKQGADPSIKDITGKSVYQYIDMMPGPDKARLMSLLKQYEAKQ